MKPLLTFVFGSFACLAAMTSFGATTESVSISINGNQPGRELHRFWTILNYPTNNFFRDAAWAALFRNDWPLIKGVNCVRLMGGRLDDINEWFKGVKEDGSIDADFTGLIEIVRNQHNNGFRPYIVLDNVPWAMSESRIENKYGNTSPPMDEAVWAAYIEAAVREMVDALGMETVSQWRFRVGTEPDLNPGHWQGTKEEYLKHYDHTVGAVTRVIPGADIGPGNILNPTEQPVRWGLDIIDHCAQGTNYLTGNAGSRMGFFQISWYCRVGVSITSFEEAIRKVRDRLGPYPQFATTPIDVAEFGALRDVGGQEFGGGGEISEWSAGLMATIAEMVYRLDVREVHQWTMWTIGVPDPRMRVLELLDRMAGGNQLAVEVPPTPDEKTAFGVIAAKKGKTFSAFCFNHHADREGGPPRSFNIRIAGEDFAKDSAWKVREWRVDRDHGVFIHQAYADLEANGYTVIEGSPLFGGDIKLRYGPKANTFLQSRKQSYLELSQIKPRLWDDPVAPVEDGILQISVQIPPHGVALLEIEPLQPSAAQPFWPSLQ